MARNKVVVYKKSTDLRGKRVELRNEEIVDIPLDAQRTVRMLYIQYSDTLGQILAFQCTDKRTSEVRYDIMKVVK